MTMVKTMLLQLLVLVQYFAFRWCLLRINTPSLAWIFMMDAYGRHCWKWHGHKASDQASIDR